LVDRIAGDHGRPAGECGHAPFISAGIAFDDDHVLDLYPELVRGDLRKDRIVALPLRGEPGIDIDLAGDRMDLDMPALIWAEACALDIEGKSQPEMATLAAGRLLSGGKFVPADRLARHLERLEILAAVELDPEPVGEEQPLAHIGKLVVMQQIAPA